MAKVIINGYEIEIEDYVLERMARTRIKELEELKRVEKGNFPQNDQNALKKLQEIVYRVYSPPKEEVKK